MRRKINLATTETVSGNYAGELARPYVAAAILSGRTLSNQTIRILENVKYKTSIRDLDITGAIAVAGCDFADIGTITMADRVLQPIELQVNLEFCKTTYVDQWEALQMGAGRLNESMPTTLQGFILEHVAAKVAENTEHHIWNGQVGGSTGYALFDGINHIISDASVGGVNETSDSTNSFISASTSAGIINALEDFVSTIPTVNLQDPEFTIYVNHKQAFAFQRAQAALGFNQEFFSNEKPLNYMGYKMEIANGMPDTKIIAASKNNLVFGTDLLSDNIEANVLDMSLLDGSKNCRVVMRYTAGCQIAVPEDVFQTTDA